MYSVFIIHTSCTTTWHNLQHDKSHSYMITLPHDLLHSHVTFCFCYTPIWHVRLPRDTLHFHMTVYTPSWDIILPHDKQSVILHTLYNGTAHKTPMWRIIIIHHIMTHQTLITVLHLCLLKKDKGIVRVKIGAQPPQLFCLQTFGHSDRISEGKV